MRGIDSPGSDLDDKVGSKFVVRIAFVRDFCTGDTCIGPRENFVKVRMLTGAIGAIFEGKAVD
jgi:hypothetical protein